MKALALIKLAAFLSAAALITACATQPEVSPEAPNGSASRIDEAPTPPLPPNLTDEELWQRRAIALGAIGEWRAKGRIAYRLADDAGSASMDWTQNGDGSRLRIAGPLGAGSTIIRNEGALLRVSRDGIDRLYPADAAPWLPSGKPLPVPVDAISYWLRGLPASDLPIDGVAKSDGKLTTLSQAGWQISYEKYSSKRGIELPTRLVLVAPEGQVTLKLLLRDWTLE